MCTFTDGPMTAYPNNHVQQILEKKKQKMLTSYKMSKTAVGITGDSYQENNLSSGAKVCFGTDNVFVSKGHTITYRQISACCSKAMQASESEVTHSFCLTITNSRQSEDV